MAINTYTPPSRESPIQKLAETVALGLNIAQGVQNVKLNTQRLDQLKRESEEAQKQTAALEDPTSVESKLQASILKQSGIPQAEGLSAAQIKRAGLSQDVGQSALLGFREKEETKRRLAEIAARGQQERQLAQMKRKTEKPSQNQYVAATYANRAEKAQKDLDQIMEKGFDPTSIESSLQRTGLFPEALKTKEAKQFEQARRNFITAVLRKESGAAISKSEYDTENAKYFPQVGDTPEVIQQKAEARQIAIAGLKAEAGQTAAQQFNQALAQAPVSSTSSAGRGNRAPRGLVNSAFASDRPQVRVVGNSVFIRQNGKWVEQ